MKLKDLFGALHESIELSSAEEIKRACEIIIETQAMTSSETDCLKAAHERGPLFDGDIPSKAGRDSLMSKGFICKVVVMGQDGYNACRQKGHWAYNILKLQDIYNSKEK